MAILVILGLIAILIPYMIKEQKMQSEFKKGLKETQKMTVEKFILASEFARKRRKLAKQGYSTEGVYVITNTTRNNKKYVGQSINLINRVNAHLRGHGNSDIYNHILNGDIFIVELIRLKDTRFNSLNALEKYLITENNSYYNGYNKTRGNN